MITMICSWSLGKYICKFPVLMQEREYIAAVMNQLIPFPMKRDQSSHWEFSSKLGENDDNHDLAHGLQVSNLVKFSLLVQERDYTYNPN